MPENDITPEEESKEDLKEDTTEDTPDEGNNEDAEDKVSDEAVLKRINEIEGRDYKSIEAYQKTVKERQKAFAEKGQKEKTEKVEVQTSNSVLKNLYFKANPEAEAIWETVEKEAANLKRDPFELYESSAYLKGEAMAIAKDTENNGKVSTPSQNVKGGNTLTEEEQIEKKFERNLPPGF